MPGGVPTPQAFMPSARDTTGASVYRAQYLDGSLEVRARELATRLRPKGGKPTYVLALQAKTLVEAGIRVQPDRRPAENGLPEMPGHALIPELRASPDKGRGPAQERYRQLAGLAWKVFGPFDALPVE